MQSELDWLEGSKLKDDKSVQGSDEWRKWRLQGLGASSAGVLMGVNPYKSEYQLWAELTGIMEEFQGNEHTRRGQEFEGVARKLYETRAFAEFTPETGEYQSWPILRASFDGINHALQRVIEIKCPAKGFYPEIPPYYYAQVQQQLIVSGYQECDFVEYYGGAIKVTKIPADLAYQAELINRAKNFWTYVESKTPPPTDEIQVEDEVLENLLHHYYDTVTKMELLKKDTESLKDTIRSMVTAEKTVCSGYKIQYITRKGPIDYEQVPELKGINLEPYRKGNVINFQIKKQKEKKSE